jgi:hypothetical protein
MAVNEFTLPPVQAIGLGKPAFGEEKNGSTKGGKISDSSLILVGALIQALVSKQILTEEDIFAAISYMQEKSPMTQGQAPNNAEGSGYPGAADTHKGMGAENGKMSPNRG